MTPIVLLKELKKFIEEETKDLLLPVKVNKNSGCASQRAAEVHLMNLPDDDSKTSRIPYVVLQFLKCTDSQQEGEHPQCHALIRIIAATYSDNMSDGNMCVLNLLTRIRIALLKIGIISEQFALNTPLEIMVYQDSTPPYFLGEMVTKWTIPSVKREVSLWE